WFTEAAADQVGRINPTTKAVAEFAVLSAGAAPAAIAVEKTGNIWFIESNASKIAELSPNNPSRITEYSVPGLTPLAPKVRGAEAVTMQKTNKKGADRQRIANIFPTAHRLVFVASDRQRIASIGGVGPSRSWRSGARSPPFLHCLRPRVRVGD